MLAFFTKKFPDLKILAIWFIITITILILLLSYYRYITVYPSTDDAYVNANVVQVAAQISGPVKQIKVENNQYVKKNELLFTIDPRPFQYAVNKAQANLRLTQEKLAATQAAVEAAQANLTQAEVNYEVAAKNVPRILTLVKQGKIAVAQGIAEKGKLQAAKALVVAAKSQLQEAINNLGNPGKNNAQLIAAQANLDQAQLDLQYTRIYAPADGYLANFTVRPGAMISAGQALFALIENNRWWVDANYKETDLARIKPGQKAKIRLDSYPQHIFRGVVQSVSYGSGAAFSLLPPENATGNWVKVTQRFPVKVLFLHPNPKFPLRIGASASVKINTHNS